MLTAFALVLMSAAAPAEAAVAAAEPQLAAEILVAGEPSEAIARLERELAFAPYDPAILINLGVAYAQAGDEARSREAFKAAAAASESVQLVTANGTEMDSRSLARRGLRMLENGDLAANTANAPARLTLSR